MTVTGTGMRVVVVDACPVCAHPDSRVAYRPDAGAVERFIRLSRVKYQGVMDEWPRVLSLEVRECVHCGHLWYRTQPEERYLWQMYDASRPLYGAGGDPRIDRRMLREMKSLRRVLRYRGIAGPRLLDYGGGTGHSGRAAIAAGFRVSLYEPSGTRAERLRRSLDARIVTDLNEVATEQFDVINLDQVLEHTQQPLDALCALKRLCSDRTLVRITVPDVLRHRGKADMWEGFPFSGRMHIMSPYEHLQGFNPVSLRLLLAQAGLKEVRGWSIVLGRPLDQLRRLAGTIVPAARRTHALARFA